MAAALVALQKPVLATVKGRKLTLFGHVPKHNSVQDFSPGRARGRSTSMPS
ncbi:hypothetical protein DPMN_169351 [Dreissena polymorpha]|uniref:Uncharacterized protein n=1 Tax=Dreissena polymorpha TaxID=45954 RepID=A0A9D4IC52_DREPO|nr:hypothetical protein DPMN_169351 [Dreissena polymorpha]